MVHCLTHRKAQLGRLLHEFLVGTGILFLASTAVLVILSAAVKSSAQASAQEKALLLARDGIEQILSASLDSKETWQQQLRKIQGPEGDYLRKVRIEPVRAETQMQLKRATVEAEWSQDGIKQKIVLERYVQES